MDQRAYSAVAAMYNAFPSGQEDSEVRLRSVDAVTDGLSSDAIVAAAKRFTTGDVPGQSKTFAPSVAQFVEEARNQQEAIRLRALPKIAAPAPKPAHEIKEDERERVAFKLKLLLAAHENPSRVEELGHALGGGLGGFIALGKEWGVEVSEGVLRQWNEQQKRKAE